MEKKAYTTPLAESVKMIKTAQLLAGSVDVNTQTDGLLPDGGSGDASTGMAKPITNNGDWDDESDE